VRRSLSVSLLLMAAALALPFPSKTQQPAPQQQPQQPAAQASPQSPGAPAPAAAPQGPPATAPPQRVLNTVVLDPGHGGTDSGARGATGAIEKDVVLLMSRAVRSELVRQGLRVVMTREGDQNPSFDDRAAIANAQRNAVFISLHVASTGATGTARVYFFDFSGFPETAPVAGRLLTWDTAQKPFVELSRRLADLMQVELAQKFPKSREISSGVPVRALRSVAAPAVAVEISSVTASDPDALVAMAPPLAAAIARTVSVFKPIYEAGAK
jgi:N-acetylmuramoyl-L-alanine amidase